MSKKLNNKGLSRKQVGITIAAFSALLVGGVVYAATSGVMQINGHVARGANVDLDFVDVSCVTTPVTTDIPAGAGVVLATGFLGGDYTCGIGVADRPGFTNGANDMLNWGAFLRSPGETVSVEFSIQNVGSVDAYLHAIILDAGHTGFGASPDILLSGNGTTIPNTPVPVGETVGPFQINVHGLLALLMRLTALHSPQSSITHKLPLNQVRA